MRLIQQLLMESLLVSLIGTAIGLVVAPLVSRMLAVMLIGGARGRGLSLDTSLDWRVFVFAALASVAVALLIGLVPALQATSRNLSDHLKDGQSGAHAHVRRIIPQVMLSAEVGLALMLAVSAGLLTTSLMRLYRSRGGI